MRVNMVRLWTLMGVLSMISGCGVYLDGETTGDSQSPTPDELTSQLSAQNGLTFGPVLINNLSSKAFQLTNTSDFPIDSVLLENLSSPFSVSSETCSSGLAKGATCSIRIGFEPNTVGSFSETLTLRYTSGTTTVDQGIELSGSSVSTQKLIGSDAPGPHDGNRFGSGVGIANGHLVVGDRVDNSISVYEYDGSDWVFSELIDGPPLSSEFGASIAMKGDWIAVGAPRSNSGGTDRGHVYVYKFNSGTGLYELHPDSPLTASDAQDNALFGSALAMRVETNLDGSTLLIGAPGHAGTGKAYTFVWDDTGDTWSQDLSLSGDGDPGALFGSSMALNYRYSVSGETRTILAVGAPGDTESALSQAGAVYTFEDPGSGFALLEKIVPSDSTASHYFGESLSIQAFDLLIGAPGDSDRDIDSGAAYQYRLVGPSWSLENKYHAKDASAGYEFGTSVEIAGDKKIIGSEFASPTGSNRGAVYIFEDIGGTNYESIVYDTSLTANSRYGKSLAMNGDFLIVGAPYDNDGGGESGASIVYDLETMGVQNLSHPSGSLGRLGNEMAVLGDIAAVGDDNGEVVVYQRDEDGNWTFLQSLIPAGITSTDEIALSGNVLVFGDSDRNSDIGVAEIYRFDGSLYQHEQTVSYSSGVANEDCGDAIGLDGNFLALGCDRAHGGGTEQGMVVTFTYDGSTWIEDGSVLYGSDPEDYAEFGASVRIDGDWMVVGAYHNDNDGTPGDSGVDEGVAYVYQHDGSSWNFFQRLSLADASITQNNARFGFSVDVSGEWLAVGVEDYDPGGVSGAGAVFMYSFNGTSWEYIQKIESPIKPYPISTGAALGKSLSLFDDTLVVMDDEDSWIQDVENLRIYKLNGGTWDYQRGVSSSVQYVGITDVYTSMASDGDTAILGLSLQPIPGSSDTGVNFFFDLDILNPYE